MERLLTGLTGFSIKKVLSVKPTNLEVTYNQETLCPDCDSAKQRIKASFWRRRKSTPPLGKLLILHVLCHKFNYKECGRYFNTRMSGVCNHFFSTSTNTLYLILQLVVARMVKKWFPNAKIVTDRVHVIKLLNHHFSKTCTITDEDNLTWGRGGLIRAMSSKPFLKDKGSSDSLF